MVSEPSKNLHAAVPPALLESALQMAVSEGISFDELVQDAMKRRLEPQRSKLDELFTYGKRQAQAMGLKASDVQKAIDEVRAEDMQHAR